MKLIKIVGFLSVLLILLAGCDSDNTEPIAQLPQTMIDNTGVLQISYPDGWIATPEQVRVNIANSQQAFTNGSDNLSEGQITGSAFFMGQADLDRYQLTTAATPREVLDAFIDSSPVDVDINTRDEYTFGSYEAIISRGRIDRNGIFSGAIYSVIKVNNGFVLFLFSTLSDETEQFYDQVRQITTTLVYTPPADE